MHPVLFVLGYGCTLCYLFWAMDAPFYVICFGLWMDPVLFVLGYGCTLLFVLGYGCTLCYLFWAMDAPYVTLQASG